MKEYILSLETSGNVCSVAISKGNEILLESGIFMFNKHDKLLSEMIRRALSDTDITISELNAVAVSAGPGSFTGLRIGAAVAKGICFDDQPKLIGVPNLNALAYNASLYADLNKYSDIIAVIPSHKELLYLQKFDKNGNPLSEITIQRIDETKPDENSFVCGPAKAKLGLELNELFDLPGSRMIAKSAFKLFKEDKFDDAEDFSPMYVQEFVPKKSEKKI